MKRSLLCALLLLSLAVAGQRARGQTVTVDGSSTLLDLSQKWAAAYQARHAEISIQTAGRGAAEAFNGLAQKQLDVVLISRAIRYKEAQAAESALGQRPAEYKVAISGLAVYVHTNNPIKVLTYDELFAVYRGKHQNWHALAGEDAPISVYAQETNHVLGELFNEEVLNGKGITTEVHYLPPIEILAAVARDSHAIGFGSLPPVAGLRTLTIKRAFSSTPVEPNESTIASRIYPISRFVYCYTDAATDKPAVKAYLEWLRSDEGQQVAKAAGYYPLPDKWRTSQ